MEANSSKGKQILSFTKEIKVVIRGNEDEILQSLNTMGKRDKEQYRRLTAPEDVTGGNRNTKLKLSLCQLMLEERWGWEEERNQRTSSSWESWIFINLRIQNRGGRLSTMYSLIGIKKFRMGYSTFQRYGWWFNLYLESWCFEEGHNYWRW